MIEAIAIDDEPVALDIIKNHADKVPFINLNATFFSATEALAYLKGEEVQLVFLDINMPDVSGLEFVSLLEQPVQVIFTTAFADYAIKGFELAVTDYLLKPINLDRFLKACQLARKRMTTQIANIEEVEQKFLFVKDGYNWIQIKLDSLLYIEGEDNYISLHEYEKRTLTRMTLTEVMNKLPKKNFLRVHKSFIVALSRVEKIEKHQVIVGGKKIPVSIHLRNSLLQSLTR